MDVISSVSFTKYLFLSSYPNFKIVLEKNVRNAQRDQKNGKMDGKKENKSI